MASSSAFKNQMDTESTIGTGSLKNDQKWIDYNNSFIINNTFNQINNKYYWTIILIIF